jgi:hypothetical protein
MEQAMTRWASVLGGGDRPGGSRWPCRTPAVALRSFDIQVHRPILIEEQEVPTDFVMTTVTSYAEQRIQQLTQRIMSFTRLMEIINRFNLYADMKERNTTEEIVDQMRKDTELKPVSAEIIDRRTGRPATIAFTWPTRKERERCRWRTADPLYLESNPCARPCRGDCGVLESEMAGSQSSESSGFRSSRFYQLAAG